MYSTQIRQPQVATLDDGMPVLATENVQGFAVRDTNNDPVGRVDDLVVDREAGRVRFLKVADDGILGLGFGREHRMVPVDVVQDVGGDTVFLKTDRAVVATLPNSGGSATARSTRPSATSAARPSGRATTGRPTGSLLTELSGLGHGPGSRPSSGPMRSMAARGRCFC